MSDSSSSSNTRTETYISCGADEAPYCWAQDSRKAERQLALRRWPDKAHANAERMAELLMIPRVRFVETLETLRDRMDAKGWDQLGAGCFSVAFGKGDLVWKISRPMAGYQDGGREYCADLAGGLIERNAHAPRVRLMLIDNKGDYAVLMDRMDCELDNADGASISFVTENLGEAMGWSTAKSNQDSAFTTYVKSLRRRYEGRYNLDLHGANIMRHGRTGAWVITDPISWASNR